MSIVFDGVNQHLSKKCLNSTMGSNRNYSWNDNNNKKYQKMDYEKEKIKNYLNGIIRTKN